MANRIKKIYSDLRKEYGRPGGQWRLWCKRPKTTKEKEEVIIGAILTQRTNWKNVDLAIAGLKAAGVCSLFCVYNLYKKDRAKLARLIRASGFYRQKSEYLFGLAKFILQKYGGVEGMIDEYTRRLLIKLKLAKEFSYEFLQKLFEKRLRRDWRLFQDFHALIVIDGKG